MTDLTRVNVDTESAPVHGGRREDAARRYGIPKEEMLDFSASINLLGPPSGVAAAIRGAITEIAHYPEEDSRSLAGVMAEYLCVFPDEVVPGNGSIELIYWLVAALNPAKALIVEPTFSEYRRACQAAGAICDSLMLKEEDGFAFSVEDLDPEGYDLVFLCNPNNPTGYLIPAQEVVEVWRRCRAVGAGLVVDEAFIDFAGEGASILAYGAAAGLYVLRSFTKSHALAGLRLGCLVTESDFAARLRSIMPPWNVNAFARAAGEAALKDLGYLLRTQRQTAVVKERLFDDLAALPGIDPFPSEANFILCRIEGAGSDKLWQKLAKVGILVRDCRSFESLGDRFFRVAVRSQQENSHLIMALERALR